MSIDPESPGMTKLLEICVARDRRRERAQRAWAVLVAVLAVLAVAALGVAAFSAYRAIWVDSPDLAHRYSNQGFLTLLGAICLGAGCAVSNPARLEAK